MPSWPPPSSCQAAAGVTGTTQARCDHHSASLASTKLMPNSCRCNGDNKSTVWQSNRSKFQQGSKQKTRNVDVAMLKSWVLPPNWATLVRNTEVGGFPSHKQCISLEKAETYST
eukprot:823364-Pelagomonas_calceolata.AAC.7